MTPATSPEEQLRAENAELRVRLEEAEDTLRAIRSGEVDSLVVETADGPHVFSLASADATSNRLLGEILSQVSDSVIAMDLEQCVTYLNAAAERQYRISADEVLGRQLSHIFSRQWPSAEAEAAMWAAFREHGEWRGEISHRTHDGRELQVDASLTLLRDAEGAEAGMVAASRDITERKRSAAEAQRVSALLDTLLRTAPIGFCFLDLDLRFVRINDRLAEFNGISAEAHLGRHASEIVPTLADTLRAVTGHILATGEAVMNQEFSGETPATTGMTRFWNQSWYPVRDGAGEILGFGAIVEDITERKQSERNLHESERRMRLATETTGVGVWEWNVLTNAIRWDAQMFHLYGIVPTPDGFVQYSDWSGAVLPEDLPESERILQDTVRLAGQSRREFRIGRRHDAEVRVIESVETTRTNAQGETEWVVGTSLDVTDRRTAEVQLRQLAADLSEADRRKDEFLATLAHELRNPLAPIRNGLQLMKMPGVQAATVEQTRSMMDRQLTHMVRLIDDLMDVGRITRGNLLLRKEHVPLAAVVNSAVEAIRPLVEQMGQELTVTLPQQPLIVDADMTRLVQVFQNLLNNAAKYSDRGGHIQLHVGRQESDVVVTVKDTGIGIASDQLPRIFEMFAQVDRSLEMERGGLGVGLTLVHRLVEMHGGRVEARSEGPGNGSEFVVRLPIVVEASNPQASGGATEHSLRSSFRILVVDDNRDAADSLSEMLNLMGNDTRTAYDGQAGMDAAGEFRPEVILLDIGLPKLNGYEACRRIREQEGGESVVLIALTGWGQDDDRRHSHVVGFDHHMVKPVDPRALMELLAGLSVGQKADARRRINRADIRVRDSDR